jgi:hypothetical protein
LSYLRETNPDLIEQLTVKRKGKPISQFWMEGGGYDFSVYTETVIQGKMIYIHNNPVRSGLVEVPEEWYWSSARFWLLDDPAQLKPDVPEWIG